MLITRACYCCLTSTCFHFAEDRHSSHGGGGQPSPLDTTSTRSTDHDDDHQQHPDYQSPSLSGDREYRGGANHLGLGWNETFLSTSTGHPEGGVDLTPSRTTATRGGGFDQTDSGLSAETARTSSITPTVTATVASGFSDVDLFSGMVFGVECGLGTPVL